MELIAYQPAECRDGTVKKCRELVAYARFNIKNQSISEAQF
jgi:hypothetical protein